MAKNLKTGWKIIGRSGATVDGRKIDPAQLEQAAKNYNKDLFTALVWPEHERWYNMGTVEELRTEKNTEGGMDLLAIIAPNDYYLSINKAEQKLFTSMELMPDFRKSGEVYLTGLAATDSPASTGTTEMRFSSINNKDALLSVFTEHTSQDIDDQPPGWFKKLFTEKFTHPDETIMDKKALEALAAKFTQLEDKISKLTPTQQPSEKTPAENYAALAEEVKALTIAFAALKADKPTEEDGKFTALSVELAELTLAFKAAVGSKEGTDPGEHQGDGTDLNSYL
ncbi:GPO family capsid scaffolding protein [Methylobacter sp. S3L5C]|uniref:GPO family capsid scaffolding protein n=1 Tax=Methylobacter sp. S3L5C TaxID=2839024 RepID=UPI001FAC6AAF|nr:GPO family capsid scaffolding protein [Methylobacter sp. S3L5C]UOA08598.1 GPO family capsid scaffolding protein [Methylobacter sp. S3L5C]